VACKSILDVCLKTLLIRVIGRSEILYCLPTIVDVVAQILYMITKLVRCFTDKAFYK